MNTLSFIVPVYNAEKYIMCCIESLLKQDNSNNIEIILVDDGSTDSSFEICKKYESQSNRIKVFHQKNMGTNAARNWGLKQATGKWVCFVDSDDWVDKELYKTLSAEMSKDWDIIIYSYKKVNKSGKMCSGAPNAKGMEIYGNEFGEMQVAALNRLASGKYNASYVDAVAVWNKLYKREFLINNHLQFEPYMPKIQDLEFNLRVYNYAEKAIYLVKELYYYRINDDSVTHRYQPDIIEKFNIVNCCIEKFVRNNFREELKQAYYERIATHLRTIMVLYLCNKKNGERYSVRKKKFLELLQTEPYRTAMKKVNLSNFPFKERILSTAIKYHSFAGCTLLYEMEEILEKVCRE